MVKLNVARIVVGGLVAGVVLNGVATVTNVVVLGPRYAALQAADLLLKDARQPFMPLYMVALLLAGIGVAVLYASVRATWGGGPKTAILTGLCVGMLAGIPGNLAAAAWSKTGLFLPFAWTLDSIVGYMLAALAAGALYKEPAPG